MNSLKSILLAAATLATVFAGRPAVADTAVWKDPVNRFSISYPDSWRIQTDDTANTVIRIAGPLGEDLPVCRVKVITDGRVKIYPKDLADKAVSRELNQDFWQGEIAQYQNAQITEFFDPASLGDKGGGTGVRMNFTIDDGTNKTAPMFGTMLGSIYGGKRYLASCTSRHAVYEKWAPVFASILDSIQLDPAYHPFATGYYRDFLADPKLVLPRSKPGTTAEKSKQGWFYSWFIADKYHP
jgi:hypothetical protein